MLITGFVGFSPGPRVAARYSLATDLAATLGYLFALFEGALPLAADRERRRNLLQAASPVAAWRWALGHGAAAAAVSGLFALGLFAAAGIGAALAGGIETREARPFRGEGTMWLPIRVAVEPGDRTLRLRVAVAPAGDAEGTPARYAIAVKGGGTFSAPVGMPVEVELPAPGADVELHGATEGLAIGVLSSEARALGAPSPFLGNALVAGLGPALGAAALGALAAAAAAHLSGAVAALLAASLLLLASMRGFLLDAIEHGGGAAAGMRGAEAAMETPRRVVAFLLRGIPDLQRLDPTSRAVEGERVGVAGAGEGALLLGGALAVAAVAGGLGVRMRRLG